MAPSWFTATAVALQMLGSVAPTLASVTPVPRIELAALAETSFAFQPGAESLDGPEAEARISEQSVEHPAFGAADSWRINFYGGAGTGIEEDEKSTHFGIAGVSFSCFIATGLSLDLELNGLYVSESSADAFAGNVNVLFRWHFVRRDTWSIYVDAGAGLLMATENVPDGGSRFNFTPQAGVGGTVKIAQDVRLFGGVRWHHISNGSTSANNDGLDSAMVYFGLSFAH